MIKIEKKIGIPIYKQIINSVEELILSGVLKKGEQIPSINKIKNNHKLSRDTVLMAFSELKNRGIIESVVGKGYYVASEDINITKKIFLLFDELNAFKEDLYNSFLEHMGENVKVDIYFHHFNKNIFTQLINDNLGSYNYFVIMPANLDNTSNDIQKLPSDKVYILDQLHENLHSYSAVYQNFYKAIYNNLEKALNLINNYSKIVLIYPKDKQPLGIHNGFTSFCETYNIPFEVINSFEDKALIKRELYLILEDKTLLKVIKSMKQEQLTLKDDIGIISYNDTLLKEIVEGGITTISTDFKSMGKRLAKMILNNETTQVENPNSLILRNSL
ncbi:GntR family transcriptional regulator [Hyunsoonleella sp. 2307UL5-6]|uniref:GntR family transcriptional regulator n=1 Tax=Hyunsoonleella sp. 2307UL5-6 TaxID=3384768 RepID=UPI0039BCAB4F